MVETSVMSMSLWVPVVLVCAGLLLVTWLWRPRRPRSESVMHALAVTGAICVAMFLAAVIYFARMSGSRVSAVAVPDIVESEEPATPETEGRPPSPPFPHDAPVAVPSGGDVQPVVTAGDVPAERSDNGNVVLLPLSDEVIATLLSPDAAEALAKLNESLPAELRQAYAMIPLGPAAPRTGPPVLREALSSAAVREVLTPKNIQAAVSGFLQLIAAEPAEAGTIMTASQTTPDDGAADITLPAEQDSEYVPASWIDNPGLGRVVVTSGFEAATMPPEDALQPAILEALRHRVSQRVRQEFGGDGYWNKLVEIVVSDEVIRRCIVETDARTEVIDVLGSPQRMQQTYALVEFPESLEQQMLADIRAGLKQDRAISLCLTLGLLWLCAVLLSMAFRVVQHPTVWRKLITIPILCVLMIPCLLAGGLLVGAAWKGRTFGFTWNGERVVCTIDDLHH
ncbi:MAG: hypothetical protein RIK87_03225 [Fuerstiella sp.]